jgi:hypothetical protein
MNRVIHPSLGISAIPLETRHHTRENSDLLAEMEPDPQTGEMRPVTKRGQPAYIYPSREEREL